MQLLNNYVQTQVHTRFSDFTGNGVLHPSKAFMYFEQARFAIAKDSGILEALKKSYSGKRVIFVVIRADMQIQSAPDISCHGTDALEVRSRLNPPFLSRLSFTQELVDRRSGQTLIRANIDNALLLDGLGVLKQLAPECEQCLTDYLKKLQAAPLVLS